jgi:DNA-binding transcriptional ArsR family regulator
MRVEKHPDEAVHTIAAAIGEPGRARMLYSLMDGHARTGTELAIVAGVSASTASVHLGRLKEECLVKVLRQGKHRYYTLDGPSVAAVLEGLSVLAGGTREKFIPNTPNRLCAARTCYDHIAGTLGVALHDRVTKLKWLTSAADGDYTLTPLGTKALDSLGIDVEQTRNLRRRFAGPCLDWSERRPHLGGAVGAALLTLALKKKWVSPDLDSRALSVTARGKREMLAQFGLNVQGK